MQAQQDTSAGAEGPEGSQVLLPPTTAVVLEAMQQAIRDDMPERYLQGLEGNLLCTAPVEAGQALEQPCGAMKLDDAHR